MEIIDDAGKLLNSQLEIISKKNDLKISINGFEAITSFEIISKNNQKYKTFITQEMLKNKFLTAIEEPLGVAMNS